MSTSMSKESKKTSIGWAMAVAIVAVGLLVFTSTPFLNGGRSEGIGAATKIRTQFRIQQSYTAAFPPVLILASTPATTINSRTESLHSALQILGYTYVKPSAINSTCLAPHTFSKTTYLNHGAECSDVKFIVPEAGGLEKGMEAAETRLGLRRGSKVLMMMDEGKGGEGQWEELVGFLGVGYSVLERLSLREWPGGKGAFMGWFSGLKSS